MRAEKTGENVMIFLEGRVDSKNAGEIQQQIDNVLAANPGNLPMIDAGGLEYISSAGLRVLLQLTRRLGGRLEVRNVSQEVYDIFEMTGFTDLLKVSRRLRELSVEGCEVIGRGAIGTVYRVDEDTIVKVYELPDSLPMIENEQKRAKQAFLKGIPTAISYDVVKVGDRYGSVFELLRAKTYNDLVIENPDRLEAIVRDYAHFIRSVHAVEMERGELPEARNVFLGYLDALRDTLGELGTPLRELFEAMPENLHVVHGDIQMKNVMLSGDEPLLIDMDTLSVGDPVFDLMGAYVTYVQFGEDEPGNSEAFLGLTNEVCDALWRKLLACYFDDRDAGVIPEAEKRIRIVACVRFLFLLRVLNIGRPELMEVRVEHALDHLRQLLPQVDSLEIGTL